MADKGESADFQRRLRRRAHQLWENEGRPRGRDPDDGDEEYLEKARQALAIEDNPEGATVPVEESTARPTREEGEPREAIENQGKFPGLADQGEESPVPPSRKPPQR